MSNETNWKTKIPYRLIDFSNRIHPSDNYVIGVKRISDSGGAGTWVRIDENDNVVDVQSNYFINHPIYGELQQVILEAQPIIETETSENEISDTTETLTPITPLNEQSEPIIQLDPTIGNKYYRSTFIRIPKFYVKSDGNTRFWISPPPPEININDSEEEKFRKNDERQKLIDRGFHCHPAFMSNGSEIDWFCIGKYPGYIFYDSSSDFDGRMYSIDKNYLTANTENDKIYPTVFTTFNQCQSACNKWNRTSSNGATQIIGYHMLNIHELAAIQWLSLIEIATTNAALPVNNGGYGTGRLYGTKLYYVDDDVSALVENVEGIISSAANFHGILSLWGNIWEYIDGIKVNSDNKLMLWDNDGRKVWKTTKIEIPYKKKSNEIWCPGVTNGYYRNRLLTAGYNYDTSDLFLPDFTTLTSYYNAGSFSDGVAFTRVNSPFESRVCIGGSYNTGDIGGLYSYRFDMQQPPISVHTDGTIADSGDNAGDVGSRLCYAPVNIQY